MFSLPSVASAVAPLHKILKNLQKVQDAHLEQAEVKAEYASILLQEVQDHDVEVKAAENQARKIEDLLS